jgi:glycosyltransferase involved in cell wall biosynthesis
MHNTPKKRIIFCGTRGVPANYGGFETAVDEISRRFVEAGYDCDVVCRRSHSGDALQEHLGRKLIYVPGAANPKLETFASSLQTGLYLLRHRRDYDHVFWFNNANFPGIILTLLAGLATSLNTDGLEWRRKKWGWPFKAYYFVTSFLLSRLAPRLISDSFGVNAYYKKTFGRDSFIIPYGTPATPNCDVAEQKRILDGMGLEPGKYFLQITRFEPDNLPREIAQGFVASGLGERGFKYAIVGFRGDSAYALDLQNLSGTGGVQVFPAIYDQQVLYSLRQNCYCYLHGNSVGGTNPALLEALLDCPRILAIDVPFSREVLGTAGQFFREEHISAALIETLDQLPQREQFAQRVKWYDWDEVARCYIAIAAGEQPTYQNGKRP